MSENTAPEAAVTPGPLAAIAITAIIVILIVAWIAIAIGALGMSDTTLVGAFMFLWYWANNEQMQFTRLVPAMLGSLVGIGIAWLLWYGPAAYGGAGLAGALAALVLALYLDITKTVPIAVNTATMLFLTLAAAPLIQLQVDWLELVRSTVLGGLFFAGAVWGLQKLVARFSPAS
ncbi:MAG: hypothetical protein C0515_04940 [Novosphingobium sp.]|nr:hypothetical protein [Novosphingobium sp.]